MTIVVGGMLGPLLLTRGYGPTVPAGTGILPAVDPDAGSLLLGFEVDPDAGSLLTALEMDPDAGSSLVTTR
jgi:hypothetical protein